MVKKIFFGVFRKKFFLKNFVLKNTKIDVSRRELKIFSKFLQKMKADIMLDSPVEYLIYFIFDQKVPFFTHPFIYLAQCNMYDVCITHVIHVTISYLYSIRSYMYSIMYRYKIFEYLQKRESLCGG